VELAEAWSGRAQSPPKERGSGGVIDSLDFFSKVEASPCP